MPDWLLVLFRDGTVAYIAIGVLLIETAALIFMRRRLGLHAASLFFNAASGIALLLALYGALSNPDNHIWIAACMIAGFGAHVCDLLVRAGNKP